MKKQDLSRIVEPLLAWFRTHARYMPWRETVSSYRTWVSEIMLQQTRVETVIPYFDRFLKAFPDVRSLAEAEDDVLFKRWEGLGYYSRAANLRKAARLILEQHGGTLPETRAELEALPGIGSYTAGAILSIACGQPEPAVDGNVLRVLSRVLGSFENISDVRVRRTFAEELRKIYPSGACGAFTQSLMELGALVCIPNGAPLCGTCPLRELCTACREHLTEKIPVKEARKERPKLQKSVFLFRSPDGRTLIRKRPAGGMLAGLYEFPNEEGFRTKKELQKRFPGAEIRKGPSHTAVFTHVEWQMHSYLIRLDLLPEEKDSLIRTPEEIASACSLPSAFRPFLKAFQLVF